MEQIQSKKSLFSSIDNFFNKQVEALRSTPAFQKTTEQLRALSESQQIVVNQATNVAAFVIPFIVILVLVIIRFSLNSDLELRKQIEKNVISIKESKTKHSRITSQVVSPISIPDKATLVKRIKDIGGSSKVKASAITVDNFNLTTPGGQINKVSTTVKFKSLTSVMFSDFALNIQRRLKSRITKINVKKMKNKRLEGSFDITLFTRSSK